MVKYNSEHLNHTFHALADPTRRLILQQVAEQEMSVNSIAQEHDMSLAAISKHLKVLDHAGLISRKKEGRTYWCRLNTAPLLEAQNLIEHYRTFWNTRLDELDDYLTRRETQ